MQVRRGSDRARLRAALARRFTGQVPFFECYVAPETVDRVMGRACGVPSVRLGARDYVEFALRTGMDAAYLYEGWFLGRRNQLDPQGRSHYVDGTIKTRADLPQIIPPDLDLVRRRVEGFLEAACGTDVGAVYALDTSPSLYSTAVGPTDSLLALYDDPVSCVSSATAWRNTRCLWPSAWRSIRWTISGSQGCCAPTPGP